MALELRQVRGVWQARVFLGTDRASGREIRPSKSFPQAADACEARALAERWAATVAPAVAGVEPRLDGMLAWYVAGLEGRAPANTVSAYRAAAKRLSPLLGRVRYDELAPQDVEGAVRELMRRYSPRTVASTRAFLSSAYSEWVRMGVLPHNPVRGTRGVRVRSPGSSRALDEASAASLDAALRRMMAGGPGEVRARAAAAFAGLHAGLRVGEACGLRLRDLSAARRTLSVSGTAVRGPGGVARQGRPKRECSRRTVALSEAAARELGAFAAWRRSEWAPGAAGPGDPLLCSRDGGLLDPEAVSRWFGRSWRELGVPEGTRFHDLRHTHATLLAASGVGMREIQTRLGHSESRTTLDNYVGVAPGIDRAAAEEFDRAVRAAGGGDRGGCSDGR